MSIPLETPETQEKNAEKELHQKFNELKQSRERGRLSLVWKDLASS